jgi:hypothetical protein
MTKTKMRNKKQNQTKGLPAIVSLQVSLNIFFRLKSAALLGIEFDGRDPFLAKVGC